jgi:hypothetical protein
VLVLVLVLGLAIVIVIAIRTSAWRKKREPPHKTNLAGPAPSGNLGAQHK